MERILSYLFWPNPPAPAYNSPKVLLVLAICAGLVVASVIVRKWRAKTPNPVARRLSRSWSGALLLFGLVGFFMTVCRVEGIQILSMRFLWVLWAVAAALYAFVQIQFFRARHYEVLPKERVNDPRDKYLPGKQKR